MPRRWDLYLCSEPARQVRAARCVQLGRRNVSNPGAPVSVYVQARRASAASQPVPAKGARLEVHWPLDDDWYGGGTVTKQQEAEEYDDVAPVSEWTSALRERWRGELDVSRFTELAVQMQEQALKETTGGIQASSLQPYLWAINNYHEDMGRPRPAKGRSVTRAVKGMTRLQVAASEATGVTVTKRACWLPAKHVRSVHDAALTAVHSSRRKEIRSGMIVAWRRASPGWTPPFGVPSSFWRLPGDKARSSGSDTDLGNEWLKRALGSVGSAPPEGES
eukprot:gene10792-biopygen11047